MVLTAVDATQDQRDKIKATLLKAMVDMPAHKTEMRGFARGGLDILGAASLDSAKLDATRLAALKSMETHSAKHQATLLEIAAILTPEQRQKLKTLAEMRLNRHN
jgi:Spy/CpxP family protein refolding chaperone